MKKLPVRFITVDGLSCPSVIICPNCGHLARLTGKDSFYLFYTCDHCHKQPLVPKFEIKECPLIEEVNAL
jgi:hypothetical protein